METAVEWMVEKLFKPMDSPPIENVYDIIEQAKELEKKQIIYFTNDFINKHTFGDYHGIVQKYKSVEWYYNETFNNQEPDCKDKC